MCTIFAQPHSSLPWTQDSRILQRFQNYRSPNLHILHIFNLKSQGPDSQNSPTLRTTLRRVIAFDVLACVRCKTTSVSDSRKKCRTSFSDHSGDFCLFRYSQTLPGSVTSYLWEPIIIRKTNFLGFVSQWMSSKFVQMIVRKVSDLRKN